MTIEQKSTLKFLREQCPEFAAWDRETIQFVVDNLSGANCLIEARISDILKYQPLYPRDHELLNECRKLQEINMEVIKKVRGCRIKDEMSDQVSNQQQPIPLDE